MADSFSLKEGLSEKAVDRICDGIGGVMTDFDAASFKREAVDGLKGLELKERVQFLIELLGNYLPNDFEKAADILFRVKSRWDYGDSDDSMSSFAAWPLIDYPAHFGMDHPDISLNLLKELTPLFSAEFAIRPFIINHFDLAYEHLQQWISDPDPSVRRLVSEGTRSRLPWGMRLKWAQDNPNDVIALLEQLKDDESDYVRRSVANNLNDISKDHPKLVIDLCKQWLPSADEKRTWIIRHATRGLVKSGDPDVFVLLGYTESPKLGIEKLSVDEPKVKVGGSTSFSCTLVSKSKDSQRFVVDYAVHYVKANGKKSPKVFKLKNVTLGAKEKIELRKSISFKKITTRTYYPGTHVVAIHINGKPYDEIEFELYE